MYGSAYVVADYLELRGVSRLLQTALEDGMLKAICEIEYDGGSVRERLLRDSWQEENSGEDRGLG